MSHATNGNGDGATLDFAPRHSTPLPPHHIESEVAVLGGILRDGAEIDEVATILRPGDFYRSAHATTYQAMLDMAASGTPIDVFTLSDELARRGEFAEVGGDSFLGELVGGSLYGYHLLAYARAVLGKAIARRVIDAADETLREAYGSGLEAEDLVSRAEERMFRVAEADVSGSAIGAPELADETLARLAARKRGETAGLKSGFLDLDLLTDGFQPGQLVIVAARPAVGKSAFVQAVVSHVTYEQETAALLVSLEMDRAELGDRYLAMHAQIDGYRVKRPHNLTADEHRRICEAAERLRLSRVIIDDTSPRSLAQISSSARRLHRRQGLGLLAIDYIQLIDAQPGKGESRQEQVARISRRLKGIARELAIPVIALAQLNRQSEQREDRRPRLSDLRESGQLEADADLVILLHRPELYNPNDHPGEAEVIVAKNRNGGTGTRKLVFHKLFTRFDSLAKIEADERTPY